MGSKLPAELKRSRAKVSPLRRRESVWPGTVKLSKFEPTTNAGEVQVHLKFANHREQELRAWLSPEPRDWILVGFAEGTVCYNTLSDNVTAAQDAGQQDGYYDDGRVAFFAKGRIKGEYLLTMAYDSARDYDSSRDRFDTEVDPSAYYGIYADKSEQRFEAPSQRNLYLKLERQEFSAMFGKNCDCSVNSALIIASCEYSREETCPTLHLAN